MNLQQLRFLVAVVQSELNLTTAAGQLGATQPAVSKQLKSLEDELGFGLFVRQGRAFVKMTAAGERVLAHALRLIQETHNIKGLSEDFRDSRRGSITIGTTHTQARYVLPKVIKSFRDQYPEVQLHLHQGTPEQIAEMARMDRIDFAITTGARELFSALVLMPCYQSSLCLMVPKGHPLAESKRPTVTELAAHPLVTYESGIAEDSALMEAFRSARVAPDVAIAARDSDVIKTYVRLGLGVGIVADVALDSSEDQDLVAIDAAHLFPPDPTWVGFPRGVLLRRYMYDFLQLLSPHLTRARVENAIDAPTREELDALFAQDAPAVIAR